MRLHSTRERRLRRTAPESELNPPLVSTPRQADIKCPQEPPPSVGASADRSARCVSSQSGTASEPDAARWPGVRPRNCPSASVPADPVTRSLASRLTPRSTPAAVHATNRPPSAAGRARTDQIAAPGSRSSYSRRSPARAWTRECVSLGGLRVDADQVRYSARVVTQPLRSRQDELRETTLEAERNQRMIGWVLVAHTASSAARSACFTRISPEMSFGCIFR